MSELVKCATCLRSISAKNAACVVTKGAASLMRDGKAWCGGCREGVKYISYPECNEYFECASGASRVLYRKKPEVVPSSPPWTTWSGTLMCDAESERGRALRASDPNAEDGYLVVDKKQVSMPGKVRGLWTALV